MRLSLRSIDRMESKLQLSNIGLPFSYKVQRNYLYKLMSTLDEGNISKYNEMIDQINYVLGNDRHVLKSNS